MSVFAIRGDCQGDLQEAKVRRCVSLGHQPLDSAPSAFFPISPSQSYQTSALTVGTVHLDILAGREAVRGQTGGSEPVIVDAGGGVTVTVAAHALPVNTAISVQQAIGSTFLPGATPNSAPAGVVPVGEVVLDFSSERLNLSAEITVTAPATPSAAASYFVGRVVRIDGLPRVTIVARAEIVGALLVSRSLVGLPGVIESGRYVFYSVDGDVRWG